MKPEEQAREEIDRMLEAAGWVVQDYRAANPRAARGVAVREFQLGQDAADYLLFADRKAVGVVEAKPAGVTLSGVAEQSQKYLTKLPPGVPHVALPLPFAYETTGVETLFRDVRDPEPRSRRVFSFHRPETLAAWAAEAATLRARLRALPPLDAAGLRDCQVEAITGVEDSLAHDRPRALVQMATGSGKTYTAVSSVYRLLKHGRAARVLFLVDRSNLGRQTLREFQAFTAPDDGRKFTELYNVQHLTSNRIDPAARVVIATIQRVYSMLRGEEIDAALEEGSSFETPLPDRPVEVAYNAAIPPETFDFIVTDECHRSIYNVWRQVLEYFDAYLVGLTATPSKQTIGFFNKNLVMEYPHERAVAEGVNVGYDVYRIETKITKEGSTVEAGEFVDRRDRLTRRLTYERLDEELTYAGGQLDRDVVARDQIRTVVRTLRDRLFTEIFPGRTEVPKTLVFAKSDAHAEDIVEVIREEFGRGNDFAKKITYRTTGESPEALLAQFRNSFFPRIAVTVDMIATGTDIRALECLVFMRSVASPVYFEQMKGRGTRVVSPDELQAVTPDARHKTHFVIVDAVGVCERDKTESRPLERKRSVSFDALLQSVALGVADDDTLSSLAARLARLDRTLDVEGRAEIAGAADGKGLPDLVRDLLAALDPDVQREEAQRATGGTEPDEAAVQAAREALADRATAPFADPALREKLSDAKRRADQVIDNVSQDEVLTAGFDEAAREQAERYVASFRAFIEEHRDSIEAISLFYSRPYGERRLTLRHVKELARALGLAPQRFQTEVLWQAYEKLERDRVRGAGEERLMADLVALVRHAIGETDTLAPYRAEVDARFYEWLGRQERAGRAFTPEQLEWLVMVKDHVATSLRVEPADLLETPFADRGGPFRAHALFGREEVAGLLEELNAALAA